MRLSVVAPLSGACEPERFNSLLGLTVEGWVYEGLGVCENRLSP